MEFFEAMTSLAVFVFTPSRSPYDTAVQFSLTMACAGVAIGVSYLLTAGARRGGSGKALPVQTEEERRGRS